MAGDRVIKGKGGKLEASRVPSPTIGEFPKVPRVGPRPPPITTLTAADVGNDLEKIDTRVPPDQMYKVDFAEVLGKKPMVLVFAIPALCQSRVCGPVVDVAQQVADAYEPKADFIHQEVYVDDEISKGIRPQLKAFGLPTEPLDLSDRRGRGDQGPPVGRLRGGRTGRSDADDRAWIGRRAGEPHAPCRPTEVASAFDTVRAARRRGTRVVPGAGPGLEETGHSIDAQGEI